MEINNKYEFEITIGGVTTQVFPAIDDLVFEWSLEDGEEFYRQRVTTPLVFVNNAKLAIDDYDYFKAIEDSTDRCDEVVIEIYSNCTTPRTLIATGLVILTKADWDEDRCTVTIPFTVNDEYTCLIANQDEVVDFSGTTKITVGSFIGEIETATFAESNVTKQGPLYIPPSLTGSEWQLLTYSAQQIGPEWQEGWTFVREKVTGGAQPPGDGWVSEGSDWVREVELTFVSEEIETDTHDLIYEVKGNQLFEADNGHLLADVIERVLTNCPSLTVVSNFFNINPDGTEPANTVYAAANTYLDTLAIWQKSDIKRFGAFNNATKLRISWSDLYENLRNLFNVRIAIIGNTLRLEHVSYFFEAQGLDLTTAKPAYLNGTRSYSYDESAYTNVEKFEFMDFVSPQFNGYDILYNSSCVDPEARAVTYRATLITTDLDFCLDFQEDVDDDGFFLANVALYNAAYYIQKFTIPTFTVLGPQFNGHLAFPNLHSFYWKHDRVFLTGEMNETATTFETTIRSKEQAPISFKFCCDELLSFDVNELMNSQYGWGRINTATYSTKTEALTVNLLHT